MYMLGSILALLDRNAEALQLLERALALAAGASALSGLRVAEPARRWCYGAEVRGVDGMSEADFAAYRDRDFWVFGDVLEHLGDPWHVLARIRRVVPAGGHIGASLPKRPALELADVSAGGRLPLSRRRSAGPHPHPPVHAQRCFIDRAASPKPASSRLNVSNH